MKIVPINPQKRARELNPDDNLMPPQKKSKQSLHQLLSQQPSEFNNPYYLNQKVFVKESNCQFLEGEIINVGSDWIKVHFIGFEAKYDVKVYIDPSHSNYHFYTVKTANDAITKTQTFSKKDKMTR